MKNTIQTKNKWHTSKFCLNVVDCETHANTCIFSLFSCRGLLKVPRRWKQWKFQWQMKLEMMSRFFSASDVIFSMLMSEGWAGQPLDNQLNTQKQLHFFYLCPYPECPSPECPYFTVRGLRHWMGLLFSIHQWSKSQGTCQTSVMHYFFKSSPMIVST